VSVLSFTRFCGKILKLALTLGQYVLARVCFDGAQPKDLPPDQQAVALSMFGSLADIPEGTHDVLVLRCGRGSGKSTISAAHCVYRLITADLSMVGQGDIAACIVICPDRDEAEDTLNKARALVENSPFLAPMMVRSFARGFYLKRPDGRVVRFLSIAKSKRGVAGRGKSLIEVILDESEFVASSDPSKIVRDSDIIGAVTPRIIQGGRLILASTPWPAESETSRLFEDNFSHPKTAVAARATTLVMRDHDPFWVKKRAKLMADDPATAEREYDCIPRSAEGSFFDADAVDRAVGPITSTYRRATCGIDLGFRNDASACVVVERHDQTVVVAHLEMESPKPGQPLVPSVICGGFVKIAKRHHCDMLVADAVYVESARESARAEHIPVVDGPSVKGDKEEAHIYLRDLLREGKLVIPDDRRLISQLKSYIAVHQSGGGLRFVPPRVQGNHCDLVAALINAVWLDRRFGQLLGGTPQPMIPTFVKRESAAIFTTQSVYR
jgi:hypothetical protein